MEVILELIFEIFGEVILQFVFEALSEAGVHVFRRAKDRPPMRPALAVTGIVLMGAICGAVSLWMFPGFVIASPTGRVVNLVVTPLLAAGAVTLIGAWRQRRGEPLVRLDRFWFAYLFAFSMAAVRFVFGSAGA